MNHSCGKLNFMENSTHVLVVAVWLLVAPPLFGLAAADSISAATTSPRIPEEARKHFVMGMTLFKDAKTPDDYSQVENEFKQAAELAPQWPDPVYNLALTKEATGDYSGAMADLKLYLLFKLSEDEARAVQDKIYALEAKAEAITRKRAKEQNAAVAEERKAAQQAVIHQGLDGGVWRCEKAYAKVPGHPWYTAFDRSNRGDNPADSFIEIHGHEINQWTIWNNRDSELYKMNPQMQDTRRDLWKTTFESRQINVDLQFFARSHADLTSYEVTISDDGRSITIEESTADSQGRYIYQRIK